MHPGDRHRLTTVVPISLPLWRVAEYSFPSRFSTIMQWRSYQKVSHKGILYGNKDKEFINFMHLPKLTSQRCRIAVTGGNKEELSRYGWEVEVGWMVSRTPDLYREFIQKSRAEFSIVKHGYVAAKPGWFSDRSIYYLGSGRPVLIQDTGLNDWLPTGEGLLTFRDLPGALKGIEIINGDYEGHRHTARAIAEEYFATNRVLPQMLEAAMK
jgi:hypothetical protein